MIIRSLYIEEKFDFTEYMSEIINFIYGLRPTSDTYMNNIRWVRVLKSDYKPYTLKSKGPFRIVYFVIERNKKNK